MNKSLIIVVITLALISQGFSQEDLITSDRLTLTPEIDTVLRDVIVSYREAMNNENAAVLVQLDQTLRELIEKPYLSSGDYYDYPDWDQDYAEIGVNPAPFSAVFQYDGKMLKEARRYDRTGSLSSYTRFIDVYDSYTYISGYLKPNIEAAIAYLNEYPDGPFALDTKIIMAVYYNDLARILDYLINHPDYVPLRQEPMRAEDYIDGKYECFAQSLDERSHSIQYQDARDESLNYLDQLMSESLLGAYIRQSLTRIRESLFNHEFEGWHFCPD